MINHFCNYKGFGALSDVCPACEEEKKTLAKIVKVMNEKMPDDQRLSEIQDYLTIAGYDVPLRGYDVDLDKALRTAQNLRKELIYTITLLEFAGLFHPENNHRLKDVSKIVTETKWLENT